MRTVTIEEAINNFESVLDSISGDSEGVVISREGGEDVVVMSLSYYNGIMETIYVLQNKSLMKQIEESAITHQKGLGISRDISCLD